jgi:hypothetical protein
MGEAMGDGRKTAEPEFVNLLRSPESDSQPGGIRGLLKRLKIRALIGHEQSDWTGQF